MLIMHAHTGLCTVNRPPMFSPSQGMIQRLKCDLVHALALSLSNSFTVMPAGESMMELLRAAVARIVVGEGGGGGGVVV